MLNYNVFYQGLSSDVPFTAPFVSPSSKEDKVLFDKLTHDLDLLCPVSKVTGRRMSDIDALQSTNDQTLFNVLMGRMNVTESSSPNFSNMSDVQIADTVIPRNTSMADLSRLSSYIDDLKAQSVVDAAPAAPVADAAPAAPVADS